MGKIFKIIPKMETINLYIGHKVTAKVQNPDQLTPCEVIYLTNCLGYTLNKVHINGKTYLNPVFNN